jgi:hypothetical protein
MFIGMPEWWPEVGQRKLFYVRKAGGMTNKEVDKLLKKVAFDHFDQTGEWPSVSTVHREAVKRYGLELPFTDALQFFSKHSGAYSTDAPTSLNVRDLQDVDGSAALLNQFIAVVRICVTKFEEGTDSSKISSDDLRHLLGFEDLEVRKMHAVLQREFLLTRSGSTDSDRTHWWYDISPDIHLFRNVQDVSGYLAVVDRLVKPGPRPPMVVRDGRGSIYSDPDELRARNIEAVSALSASEPQVKGIGTTAQQVRRVFVLMPFRPLWSKRVYKMIKGCCDRANLGCLRADDITKTGRITEQIIQAISNANIVIADITRTNPNVLYELGFAHANAKKVIVLNQGASSPFDVNDWRQIRYNKSHLNPASRKLSQFLRSAIEELDEG